jgi:hypothetical protein
MVATGVQKQEEFQHGGKSGSLKLRSLSSSFLTFFILFIVKKMTTISLLFSFISF